MTHYDVVTDQQTHADVVGAAAGWHLHEAPPHEALEFLETHYGRLDRTFIIDVSFGANMNPVPKVELGIIGFDVPVGSSARLELSVGTVDSNSFQLKVKTWADTRVHSVKFQWAAQN